MRTKKEYGTRTLKYTVAACAFLTCFTLAGYAAQFGDFTYVEYATYIKITDYPEDATGDVIIPSEIVGKPVTSIGNSAFRDCTSLTSVTIPDSVTSIAIDAFSGCTSLTAITVNAANSAYSSVDGVLFDENQIMLLTCPEGKAGAFTIPDSVTSIGDWAFERCNSLTSVTIPNSVTTIGWAAFFHCFSLTSVTIPDSVTSIGDAAFSACTSLTAITVDAANPAYISLDGVVFEKNQTSFIQYPGGKTGAYTIPDSVTSIVYGAFGACTSLTSVTIPDSVRSIGEYAFRFCNSLTSVTIPDSVTSIENYAFYDCSGLTSVYFAGDAPNLGLSVFEESNNAIIYYLSGTTGWGETYGDRPAAPINVLPDPLIGGTPVDAPESWFLSEWLGIYYTYTDSHWLSHAEHGFIYRYPESTNASMFIYDDAMGAWWWTNETVYPFVYAFDPSADNAGTDIEDAWLWCFEGEREPRVFSVMGSEVFLFFGP